MSNEDKKEITEVSVSAKIDETGLDLKARSRLVTALDRLSGNLLEIPATWFEGHAQRIRSQNEARKALSDAETLLAVEQLRHLPSGGRRALDVFLADQDRKQRNRDAVAIEAFEVIKALPPPAPAQSEPDQGQKQISEDWLNVFSLHVENASSDHFRSMWGRILAGEIRRPGAFSLTTLRLMSELDMEIASTFQRRIADALLDGTLPLSNEDHRGEKMAELHFLEDVGLLSAVGAIGQKLQQEADGYKYLQNGDYLLRIKDGKHRPIGGLRVDKALITRSGRELASILPAEPEDRALRAIARNLHDEVESIEIFKRTGPTSGDLIETLKPLKDTASSSAEQKSIGPSKN